MGNILYDLRQGRFSTSYRPYRKRQGSAAGDLFWVKKVDESHSLLWTIEIQYEEQVDLLSLFFIPNPSFVASLLLSSLLFSSILLV
jgi:hypothetical protein